MLYPGKVLADERAVGCSSPTRITTASSWRTLDGKLIETIGSGLQGDNDGIFSQARFYRPQGLALDRDDQLYVADTENHQIRVVDFQARAVQTLAGTGKQGAWGGEGGDAMRIDLNSPWDLALKPGILIVAMAGPHQIWVIDLLHDQAYPYAGTGEEARRDGAVNEATFAQPSGLAIDGNTLYVADAESNTIRAVRTAAGQHRDDDRRRRSVRVRRQGRQGRRGAVAASARRRPHTTAACSSPTPTITRSRCSIHRPGTGLDASRSGFYEPGGLSIAGNTLYVADTNNHAIRTVDLVVATGRHADD